MERSVTRYFQTIDRLCQSAEASRLDGTPVGLGHAIGEMIAGFQRVGSTDKKIMFVGNGGSAGIASHMATDYSKNGGLRAWAMNDGSMLTCLANDFGYEHVFAKQIEFHGRPGDLLVAISSSGQSPNILAAVKAARSLDCTVLTLSGFAPDNPLRRSGDMNLYLGSSVYGYVEIGHLALCHAILDLSIAWKTPPT
jgi:D-sedoheptulose 7-phosphate isomerase